MNKKNFVNKVVLPGALAIVAAVVPFVLIQINLLDGYSAQILIMCAINAIMALSVNIICGITGQLSLGQAGFMALGGYATILLTDMAHLPLPVSIILAALITAFFGFLIGFPTLRLEGDYLAIVTLAFGEIIRVVLVNLKDLTGGPNGKQFNTTLTFFDGPAFFVITGILILIIILLQNFIRSTYGRAILAVREDEVAANANGIGVFKYKMIGFVIASFVAGIGGALYVSRIGFIKPDQASFTKSIDYLIFVVLGGMGSTTGAILAAYVLTFLQEVLRFLKDFRLLIYPVVLIIVMIFRPQGLLGTKEFSFEALFAFFKNFGKKGSKGVEKNVRK
ncbi:MAG: branched-chain amino acid ABC transporter permease [Treponema sp.]|uniref:branched-chain amino acid ABC transporter permease n=1 Tax=Treponema sp. TaxID=166 RepID=UPI001D6D0DF1|nr:branched-chain amino acid ABC transporter permease [Treponema sp.]MBS7311149.1 branched-chain amino acid ABC transporter permease [Treponema sp.]MCI5695625.1 branched-chain amino acid ABC transporter permease [Spirochaetia bacterium]MDY5885791.1 branched-chain amino acid ABC transporter permease [Treponema sp.]